MVAKVFLASESHKVAARSLYRQLIRRSRRIKNTKIPNGVFEENNKTISKELEKYNYDPDNYMTCLSCEVNYNVKEEFSVFSNRKVNSNKLFKKLTKGIEISEYLNGAIKGGPEPWKSILQSLIDYRRGKFRQQEWKADYIENKEYYDKHIYKDNPAVLLKKQERKINAEKKAQRDEKNLSKRIKRELKESTSNSAYILRRFLKNGQMDHKIPIPHLLPYTKNEANIPIEESVKLSLTIPGSTKLTAIEEAYDMDYIEGVIKPGIEFDINKHHYLDNLKEIVQVKGPFKVQVNLTEAGPMSIPYIRLPYPRIQQMKEVGLDIKYSMRLIRLKTVWNVQPGDNSLSEPKFSDGSYSVRSSKGFRDDERVHPRYYYENLAIEEGIWEYMMQKTQGDNDISLDKSVKSYLESLDVSSKVIDDQLNYYFQKYKVLKSPNSPLIKEQKELQVKMNHHYDVQLNKYKELIKILRENNVVKHSEILNSDVQEKTYRDYINKDDSKMITKHKKGIPELERIGMGKKLGDYLDDLEYHNFKLGEKFVKRFKF